MDTAIWIALITSVGTGIALKVMDIKWLPRKDQQDIATAIRNELRADNERCRKELKTAKAEIDYWKKIYFQLIELLYKNHVEIPDKYIQPYKDDPDTPDIPPQ